MFGGSQNLRGEAVLIARRWETKEIGLAFWDWNSTPRGCPAPVASTLLFDGRILKNGYKRTSISHSTGSV
jgi:hypothetical protein